MIGQITTLTIASLILISPVLAKTTIQESGMKHSNEDSLHIPLSVPSHKQDEYIENYTRATQNTGRLFLFAGDQKIEHLHEDFLGQGISPDSADPEHLFRIADQGRVGIFATQLGMIAQYGADYSEVNYLVKLNSKTNIIPSSQQDPKSSYIVTPDEAITFKNNSSLNIVGMGYTIYLGSAHEAMMLRQASEMIQKAHNEGMIAVLWIYPRGKAITNEKAADVICGAAGVGLCLGADFVKVNPPQPAPGDTKTSANLLKDASTAAGRTKIICSGGSSKDPHIFLAELYDQIHIGGAFGNATGRNIHQKDLSSAVRMCQAIAAIVLDNKTAKEAQSYLER